MRNTQEVLFHEIVHLFKVRHIVEINIELHDVLEFRTRFVQHGPKVRERHVHLCVEPFNELTGLGINPQLSGGEDEVADTDRLVIRTDRGHGLGRIDERMHFFFPHF